MGDSPEQRRGCRVEEAIAFVDPPWLAGRESNPPHRGAINQ
jgi:hypothetical protein